MMYTEIIFEHKRCKHKQRDRKDENSPFWRKFDVFEFGILHSDGHNVFATSLLDDENAIADCSQRIHLHDS